MAQVLLFRGNADRGDFIIMVDGYPGKRAK
jgi:hypothetical protein